MKYLYFLLLLFVSTNGFSQFGKDTYIDFPTAYNIYPYGSGREVKCVADFDNDGHKDIIYSLDDSKIIFIKNTGTTFGDPQVIYNPSTTDSWFYSIWQIVAADINNDNKMDFVVYFSSGEVPTTSGRVAWFKNMGNNTFQQNSVNGITGWGNTMSVVDIDHNGYKDIVVATDQINPGAQIYISKNNNGVFQTSILPGSAGFYMVAAGDLNNDTYVDLVGENSQGIYWFRNNHDTSFTQMQNLAPNVNTRKIITADVNNDGLLDILFSDAASNYLNFYLIKNSGGGNFAALTTVSQNLVSSGIDCNWQLSDADEDGLIDISFINAGTKSFLRNLGGFTFGSSLTNITLPVSPDLIADGGHWGLYFQDDFNNNDSIKEVAIISFDSLILCTKSAPSTYIPTYSKSHYPVTIDLVSNCDIDNDGDIDIIASGKTRGGTSIVKYIQDSNHSISPPVRIIDSSYNASILLTAKLDAGNTPDILFYSPSKSSIYVSLNTAGTFSTPQTAGTSVITDGLFLDDVDADGDIDILGYHNNEIFTYLNNGNGTFSSKNTLYTSPYLISYVQINDWDNDGKKDIIYASFNSNKIIWLKNLGYPTYAANEINYTFSQPISFAVADIDGDQQKDLIVYQYTYPSSIYYSQLYVLFNRNFMFSQKSVLADYTITAGNVLALRDFKIQVDDIDGDNDNDIILCSSGGINDNHVTIYDNDGFGNFIQLYNETASHFNSLSKYYFNKDGVTITDLNNDGDKDFIFKNSRNEIIVTESKIKGNGTAKAMAYWDANNNQAFDIGELVLRNQRVKLTPVAKQYFSSASGYIYFYNLFGSFTATYTAPANWTLTTSPAAYNFTAPSDTTYNLFFGVKPTANITRFNPSITSDKARCSEMTDIRLDVNNDGTVDKKVKLELLYDSNIQYLSSSVTPDTIATGRLVYIMNNIRPTFASGLNLKFGMPAFRPAEANIYPLRANTYTLEAGNIYTYNATDSLPLEVKCAFDPNDKIADPIGTVPDKHYTLNTSTIDYTIHFQNTGTDTARSVYITDTLSGWYSSSNYVSPIKIVSSSHVITKYYLDQWVFPNILHIELQGINLPDSGKSYMNSQGFVRFSITPASNIPNQTLVKNKANIIFDRNAPVTTAEAFNTFVFTLPSILSAGADKTICAGQSVTLTATGGTNYSWNTGQNTATILVSPTTTTAYIVTGTVNGNTQKDTITVFVNPLPVANAGTDKVICAGGAALLKATGGATYSWSNGKNTDTTTVAPSSTSNYIVIVTSAQNCSSGDTVNVTVNPTPVANAGIDQTICSGMSALLQATGGPNYSWNNGKTTDTVTVTPAFTTDYILTITNVQTCSDKDTVKVIVNPTPTANAGSNKTICQGQKVQLKATGGPGYSWSNGPVTDTNTVSPMITTDYIIKVTSAQNCSSIDTVRVNVNPKPDANAGADQTICSGDAILLRATGGTGYSWNIGRITDTITVTPSSTSDYIVTVRNVQNCTDKDTVTVNVISPPNAVFTKTQNGSSVQFNGPSGMTSYNWNFGDTGTSLVQSPLHTYSITGIFTITLTVNIGNCANTYSDSVNILVTGIKNSSNLDIFEISPNPSSNTLHVLIYSDMASEMELSILDVTGKIYYTEMLPKNKLINHTIDISKYTNGIYFIQIKKDNETSIKKIVIK